MIIGIDPGITGGIAILETDRERQKNKLIQLSDMPLSFDGQKKKVCGSGLAEIINPFSHDVVQVYLERVGARPGQGVVSMFSFGRAYGAIEAAVGVFNLPLAYVLPQHWKRSAGLLKRPKDDCRARALELYPDADVHRKKDNGRADAILIAHFGEISAGETA